MKKFIKKIKSNKFLYILSVLIIGVFIILITRVTYAFLAPIINEAQTNVAIKGDTIDDYSLKVGNPLKLDATPTTLKENGSNYTTSTTATASLKANSTKNTATYNYYLYFQIENNTFTYTSGTTPEIILTITNPNGEEVTSISGLTYGTFNGVSGFDVTTKNGLFNIANNYQITSNSSTTATIHEWTITLTYLNQSYDQSANFGKSMEVGVLLQKEKIPLLADYVKSLYTGTQGENSIYYHDSGLTNGAGDNSYRYAGGDYVLTEAGKATGATMMIGYNNKVTTSLIDFYCNGTKQYVGATCSASQTHYYLIKGDTTQYQTYKETLNKAVEKGYLTKDNVKNFVCFGSTTSPCPTENLYRIIGVFGNNVKLIKYDYATSALLGTNGDYKGQYTYGSSYYKGSNYANIASYYWNISTQENTWSESNLNKTNLNTNFVNNIGTEWANKIATTTWKVGGNTYANIYSKTPSVVYQNEIVNPDPTNSTDDEVEYTAKIGLMYVSDYGFAAGPSAWTLTMDNYNNTPATSTNWMYMGLLEWTISRGADNSLYAFIVNDDGVGDLDVDYDVGCRPSFNLESSITYVSGSGSANDPIVIN